MLKWGVERRLEFIEFRLFWEGGVNRADLIEMFGVSVPQASNDLTLYQTRAPHNAVYDKSAKRYVAGPDFAPVFLNPDPDSYLMRLRARAEGAVTETWIAAPPQADIALTPHRAVDSTILRAVLAAVRTGKSLDILYQSMSRDRPDAMWRRMTPHAFGHDGFRWHVRSWCHVDGRFKDFLLPRILEVGEQGAAGADGTQDRLWHDCFDIVIVPHPLLSPGQQAVVAKDFGMEDGQTVLTVRYAMLFYVLKRLGLLDDASTRDPRSQHIVARDAQAVAEALQKVKFEFDEAVRAK